MRTLIIALSAHALQEHRDRCQRAGMDGFLTKPIRRRELLNEIDRIGRRAESPSAVRPPPAKVIDRQSFLERVDGNLTMIDEILDAFPKHCAALMSSARKALAGRDMPTLSYSIHTLLGMFRNLSADGSADLAAQIEARIPEANHYELQKLFVLLERQVGLLSQALPSLAHRDTPISFKAIARPPPVMMTRRPSKQTAHRESMPV
jgi:CheY-like chemotaxis protein